MRIFSDTDHQSKNWKADENLLEAKVCLHSILDDSGLDESASNQIGRLFLDQAEADAFDKLFELSMDMIEDIGFNAPVRNYIGSEHWTRIAQASRDCYDLMLANDQKSTDGQ